MQWKIRQMKTKNEIRAEFKEIRKNITAAERKNLSSLICQKIAESQEFNDCDCIGFYAADNFEVDLRPLFKKFCGQKRFYLPRFNAATSLYDMVMITDFEHDLIVGKYGISEPKDGLEKASQKELESMLFLVPGVAFDSECQRLGRGKGFYDRLLLTKKFSVGVFFECQRAGKIPIEEHDIALDLIITEKSIYKNA